MRKSMSHDEFRLARYAQDLRAEQATGGYDPELKHFYGHRSQPYDRHAETPLTYRQVLDHAGKAFREDLWESEAYDRFIAAQALLSGDGNDRTDEEINAAIADLLAYEARFAA